MGVAVSVTPGGGGFSHPWRPALGQKSLQLSLGLLNGFTPMITTADGVVSMDPGKGPAPALELKAKDIDPDTQQSWACLEVTANADGSVDKHSLVVIVHRSSPTSIDPKTGRQPLALILWQKGAPVRCLPQCWFNLKYYRVDPPPGGGIVKHLFL